MSSSLDIGIVGGGINGMASAWVLAKAGHKVTVYEQSTLMSATSSASSKLLHGGLRYLENLEFRLVYESLRERDSWFKRAPQLAKPVEIFLPVYKKGRRSRLTYTAGLKLYDLLAGKSSLPRSKWLNRDAVIQMQPDILKEGLIGAYSFWDGQMDDLALGQWVVGQAVVAGTNVMEYTSVEKVSQYGQLTLTNGLQVQHDRLINLAGPWAQQLAERSGLKLPYELDLVRGSHIVLNTKCPQAWLLEVPGESRIFFVLPWKGQTLVGTTEVRTEVGELVACTVQEQDYLLSAYRHYFSATNNAISDSFAGVRPLIKSADDPGKATREYVLQKQDKLLTVLGGKWTTCMALAEKVKEKVIN